ncbi:RICIN domain-containing protein [Streptomyces sp.]|uniref:RICIN domain-containing protein n=1 Tax=Streptomyces sp. TaxID=1931 RepID=UPI002F95F1B7
MRLERDDVWQQWNLWGDGNGYAMVQNRATADCVFQTWWGGAQAAPCEWNNNDFKWEVWNNSGNVFFRNKSTGMCLDDSRTYGLRVIGCNCGVWQQWR